MTPGQILEGVPARSRADAIWLLSALFNCSQSAVLLNARAELSPAQARKWKTWWRKRNGGEPLQYICGTAPFWGREFAVDPRVLIPRPETERLVEIVLDMHPRPGARVLDIGTGSGCIAITLKGERNDLDVVASDVSAAALRVARKNAGALGIDVRFEKQDLFSPALRSERWDVVVSNPPYLEFGRDFVAANVKKWEPRGALEPALSSRMTDTRDRASWCAERILRSCEESPPRYTALELSPRVAAVLERRWGKRASVERAWRMADLAGRKRFLLIAWK